MAHIPKTLQSHTVCSIVDALLTITLQVIPSRFISYEAGDADGLYSVVNFPLVLLVLLRMISWMVSVGSRRRTSPRALWTWWEFIAWSCFCSSASVSAHLDMHLSKRVSVCDWGFFVLFLSHLFSRFRVQSLNRTPGEFSPQRPTVSSADNSWWKVEVRFSRLCMNCPSLALVCNPVSGRALSNMQMAPSSVGSALLPFFFFLIFFFSYFALSGSGPGTPASSNQKDSSQSKTPRVSPHNKHLHLTHTCAPYTNLHLLIFILRL